MIESRITKRQNRTYCMIDGEKCCDCRKCENIPIVINQVSKSSNKWIIALIILFIIILLLSPLLSMVWNYGSILMQIPNNDYGTSSGKYQDYDVQNSYYDSSDQSYDRVGKSSTSTYNGLTI